MSLKVSLPVLVMKAGIAGVIGSSGLANWTVALAAGAAPRGAADVPGWVSGNLASLAASGTATIVFDLGPDWAQYRELVVAITATQAIANIVESASDDGSTVSMPLPGSAADGSLTMTVSTAGTVQGSTLVCGRYVILAITNGGVQQGAAAGVRLVAYPN